ncbi:MAG TPA: hypothetical protein DCL21_03865 [Alphaproteobacteria bacterium]|nr:hypothetical protein [Alphaproteobacteria bacterium]
MEKDIIKVDSCVIGGSIVGLWTALDLAKKAQKVLVVDKTYIGQEKSNVDICINHMCNENMYDIALKAQEKWLELKEHNLDLNIELRGSLSFALNHEEEDNLNTILRKQKQHIENFESFIIKDKQAIKTLLKAREIGEQVRSALVSVEDLSLNHQACLDYLRQQLIKNGAQFWGSDEVIDVELKDKKITGLITKESIIKADNIVLATGAKSKILLDRLDLKMPLRPARAHIVEYTSKTQLPQQILNYKTKFGEYICKSMLNGRNHLIYTGLEDQMQATWSRDINQQVVNSSILEMIRILPILEYADIQDCYTAQLAVTPDRMPFFGKTKFYDNLYVNIGLNSSNYMLAPYFAQNMAKLIDKKVKNPDLAIFNPDRFMLDDYKIDYKAIAESETTIQTLLKEFSDANEQPAPEEE